MSAFGEEKIRVRFTTTHAQYRVPEVAIAIPAKLGRYGMSEVINHLLELNSAVPFDFMLNDTLIRTSLRKVVSTLKVDTENVVSIEYMPVTTLSNNPDSVECPAWIGSIECLSDHIVAGSYDGQLQSVNKQDFSISGSFLAHNAPIRSLTTWMENGEDGRLLVATASKDQSMKILCEHSPGKFSHLASASFNSSVECVKYWKEEKMLLASDYSGNLYAYNPLVDEDVDRSDSDVQAKKKGRTNSNGISERNCPRDLTHKFSIRAHTQSTSGIAIGNDAGRVYTCSHDHSIKEWDMERQECVATFMGAKVCTSMHIRTGNRLIATSHPDGRVRLWDSRNRQDSVCSHTFPPAKSNSDVHWVSQVRWNPRNAFVFASSNYNGEVCAWDIRSTVPLSTVSAHDGKVFCLDWSTSADGALDVVSGGSDCAIKSCHFS